MKVKVRCTIDITVNVPDDWKPPQILFDLEANHCLGTGIVGAKIEELIKEGIENNYCPFCPDSSNRVLEIDGKEI